MRRLFSVFLFVLTAITFSACSDSDSDDNGDYSPSTLTLETVFPQPGSLPPGAPEPDQISNLSKTIRYKVSWDVYYAYYNELAAGSGLTCANYICSGTYTELWRYYSVKADLQTYSSVTGTTDFYIELSVYGFVSEIPDAAFDVFPEVPGDKIEESMEVKYAFDTDAAAGQYIEGYISILNGFEESGGVYTKELGSYYASLRYNILGTVLTLELNVYKTADSTAQPFPPVETLLPLPDALPPTTVKPVGISYLSKTLTYSVSNEARNLYYNGLNNADAGYRCPSPTLCIGSRIEGWVYYDLEAKFDKPDSIDLSIYGPVSEIPNALFNYFPQVNGTKITEGLFLEYTFQSPAQAQNYADEYIVLLKNNGFEEVVSEPGLYIKDLGDYYASFFSYHIAMPTSKDLSFGVEVFQK
jgi:hypothetical protein